MIPMLAKPGLKHAASRRHVLGALMAGMFAAAAPTMSAHAQADYPSRPIRVLVGFPAGGTNDVVTRLVTNAMSQQTGWSFVVENRPGAGSNVAMEALSTAPADGYTILINTPGVVINPSLYEKVRYQWDSFEPIGMIGEAPLVLLVNPKLPIQSIADLQAASKDKSKPLKFASSGNGSSSHLAMDMLRATGQVDYLHIPYRGGAQAITDTIAGLTDLTMQPITNALEQIRSQKLRALGQTGRERMPTLRDVPTIAEGGVKDFATSTWYVALAPAKTPRAVIDKLSEALDASLRSADLQAKLEHAGLQVTPGGPQKTAEMMRQEHAKWTRLIAASGTRVE